MTITDDIVEVAARAGYAATQKKAVNWYAGTMLDRFIPWDDISKEWRTDYKTTIRAALEAVKYAYA